MIDITNLQDGSILVCPNSLKKELVKNKSISNITKDIKFLSKEDLIKGFYFSYDINALYYIHKHYEYDYNLSKEILENLHNISPINDKLKLLCDIYNDLESKNLLKFNPYFKQLFNNKKIYILGYLKEDVELFNVLEKLSNNFEYLNDDTTCDVNLEVKCFSDIETEISYVMSKIGSLVKSGVSLNKIYFYTIFSEYKLLLKKELINHSIILDSESEIYIYDTPVFKTYLELLKDYSFTDAYQLLLNNTPYDPQDVLGMIVDLIIEVTSVNINKDEQIELLCYLASFKKVQNIEYKESIKEINDTYYLNDDEYCFMLGFSLGNHPVISKDTEFYLDSEKLKLNRNTSNVKNKINEEKLISFINRTKNLIITFKEQVGKDVYYPSLLINKLNMKLVTGKLDNIRYSKKSSIYEVSKYYDLNRLYGVINKWMDTFSKDELEFNSYDHLYKGLTTYNCDKELVLSYTQIDEYMKCPFKYYLKYILNIDEFVGSFKTEIGTMFHNILEASNNSVVDLNVYYDEIIKKFETYKDKYFANKILPEVLNVIKKNNEFHNITRLNDISYEKELKIKINNDAYLLGRIDKFLMDNQKGIIAVIDYKTGKFTFDKKKVELGLNLQLPIYALLLSEEYPDAVIAGVYIQKVLLEKDNVSDSNAYLLDGITINDVEIIKLIDPSIGTNFDEKGKRNPGSIYIKGIKVKETGELYANAPVVESDELSYLLEVTRQHVIKTIEGIKNASFDISPIDIKEEKGNACTYCKFADICNHDSNDTRFVSIKEREE